MHQRGSKVMYQRGMHQRGSKVMYQRGMHQRGSKLIQVQRVLDQAIAN